MPLHLYSWIQLQIHQGNQGTVEKAMFYLLVLLLAQVFTTTHYNDIPKLLPPKAHKLSKKQVNEMRNWISLYSQTIPDKTVQNMTTVYSPGILPRSLYEVDSSEVTGDQSHIGRQQGHFTNITKPDCLC